MKVVAVGDAYFDLLLQRSPGLSWTESRKTSVLSLLFYEADNWYIINMVQSLTLQHPVNHRIIYTYLFANMVAHKKKIQTYKQKAV